MVNITLGPSPLAQARQQREQVDITFAVSDANGYVQGSEVSNLLRKLNMVEFSYYLGFPVLQIAERESHAHAHTHVHMLHPTVSIASVLSNSCPLPRVEHHPAAPLLLGQDR